MLLISLLGLMLLMIFIPDVYSINPYEAGYNMAKNEYLHNKSYNYSCPPSSGKAYCDAYKVGYDSGWDVARAGWFG